ncbi:hypothetical protein A2852_02370 [Candidatus Adlerbacteria bacterium RIFCSPHIGHO2_01_FULL_54_23]|uniref:Segregation and condensation protein A n=3 Tax=Candidatus Adleribacteriota TaxID=1752736 RepID=A0A1F4Y118_9BACT|nr:MAG: Segregation and condensation protein A [Candidatus Adlerbacteria bacterium GW2011_GWA1_54_10]KKW37963.1 MAG: Segregation and condensation protein A [Candidatus Adlerbacteria bacterium GW2011_GWB1_54_7]OGC78571.1 MAG: hypothetical protein A2852_02370 [Candidatus Adlerbacteria bacterium RIFCSPHIGHO2_01_FULL_54_23]OGC87581.1 MAG: hypothetical protein A3B33_01565 [Candidatus Adlerbacteria bacterium RIFCSPLOWO2_01_FULL_54_16]
MPITVKTSVYEGPIEVLLELIEKRKLLINDISLAQVADDFIAYVNGQPHLPVGETADFVALAATLLLIKSRSLLPSLALSDEESGDIKELEYRLAVYQIIKDVSLNIGRLGLPMLYEGCAPDEETLFIPDSSVTPQALREAAQALMFGFPQAPAVPRVAVKKIISLEEMIEKMAARIEGAIRMSFSEFSGKKKKQEIIVGFLALLELVKRGIIRASQDGRHGDITLESDVVSTPKYGPTTND